MTVSDELDLSDWGIESPRWLVWDGVPVGPTVFAQIPPRFYDGQGSPDGRRVCWVRVEQMVGDDPRPATQVFLLWHDRGRVYKHYVSVASRDNVDYLEGVPRCWLSDVS